MAREMGEKLIEEARLQVLNDADQEHYTTRIKVVKRDHITIYEPFSGGKKLEMAPHSSWQFCLIGEDAVYFFTSRVVGSAWDERDHSLTYQVRRPEKLHRQQRRSYVRVPCHLNVLYWSLEDVLAAGTGLRPANAAGHPDLWGDPQWVSDYLEALEERTPARNAFTLDMSGGGLRMVTLDSLRRSERLLLKVELSESFIPPGIFLEGRAVRVVPLHIGGWKRYRVGVSFLNLPDKVRDSMIRHLFSLMRRKI